MGKRLLKKSESSPSSSPKRKKSSPDVEIIRRLMVRTLVSLKKHHEELSHQADHKGLHSDLSDSDLSGGSSPPPHKEKYISKDMLPELLSHVKNNMGLPKEEVTEFCKDVVLLQLKEHINMGVPIHQHVLDLVLNEWKDPDKINVPSVRSRAYPLEGMVEKLLDWLVASLEGHSSMAEDSVLRDPADKKIDGALKKVALRSGIYGAYMAQSFLSHFEDFFKSMQEGTRCPELLEIMENHDELISNISFDAVQKAALSSRASLA
ncbi:hypothetical protein NDU88_003219 [Pleurodeles waltl]|uniref:Uncharacterized protein n=1 Tax=Pleurodeles waltl TaxID=8319 RepID=A0AAV7LHW8_PLEWA|nr:hypothetical protein NDU88_003219 [Pleurodeles waltl]